MFATFGAHICRARRSASILAAVGLTLSTIVLAEPLTSSARAQTGLTEQQMIEQLLGKASRSIQPGTGSAPAVRPLSPQETARLRALLEIGNTRSFTAKERTEVAEAVRDRPSLDFEIYFPFNSSSLQNPATETIRKIGQILTNPAFAGRGFLLAGHTDAKGSQDMNQVISQRRADSVRAYLIQAYRIEPGRLRVIGYGKEQLKEPGQPFAPINRRVQIINLPDGTVTASR